MLAFGVHGQDTYMQLFSSLCQQRGCSSVIQHTVAELVVVPRCAPSLLPLLSVGGPQAIRSVEVRAAAHGQQIIAGVLAARSRSAGWQQQQQQR